MNIVVLTPVRSLGEGLATCLGQRPNMTVHAVVDDLAGLRTALDAAKVHIVLIDVTLSVDFYDVRPIALERPDVALVALGLREQRQEVVQCGRAGFAGYVARDTSLDTLCASLTDIADGRIACPPEIVGGLLRALFSRGPTAEATSSYNLLTRREGEVLQLVGDGLSNKEIANELCVSVATVKHHVHHILDKLKFQSRAQAMRKVRDAPWRAPTLSMRSAK